MKKPLLFFIFLLVGIQNMNSQTIQFLKEFDKKFSTVINTPNGYLLIGEGIAKTDFNGKILWYKDYGVIFGHASLASNNDILLTPTSRIIIRVDSLGNFKWAREFNRVAGYSKSSIHELSNGNLVFFSGSFYSGNQENSHLSLLSSTGVVIKNIKIKGSKNTFQHPRFIVKVNQNDNVFIFGEQSDLGGPTTEVLRIDSTFARQGRRQFSTHVPSDVNDISFDGDHYVFATSGEVNSGWDICSYPIIIKASDKVGSLSCTNVLAPAPNPCNNLSLPLFRVNTTEVLNDKSIVAKVGSTILKFDSTLKYQGANYINLKPSIFYDRNDITKDSKDGLVGIYNSIFFKTDNQAKVGCYENTSSFPNSSNSCGKWSYATIGYIYSFPRMDSLELDTINITSQSKTFQPIVGSQVSEVTHCFTGVEEKMLSDKNLIISPNPSTGIVNLFYENWNSQEQYKIKIVNILGKEIYSTTLISSSHAIDLSSASKGIYFVSLENEYGRITKKIVLN